MPLLEKLSRRLGSRTWTLLYRSAVLLCLGLTAFYAYRADQAAEAARLLALESAYADEEWMDAAAPSPTACPSDCASERRDGPPCTPAAPAQQLR